MYPCNSCGHVGTMDGLICVGVKIINVFAMCVITAVGYVCSQGR